MTEPHKSPAGLQKINVKLFADVTADTDYDLLLSIFGRWRLEQSEEIMDLADYAHVDHGPNYLLVGHRWHFGMDLADGRPAFLLSTRKGLSGTPADRIRQALRLLFEKAQRLLAEPDAPRSLRPRCGDLEIVLNDRLLAPNVPATALEWGPAVEEALASIYSPRVAKVWIEQDPARRLGWRASTSGGAELTIDDLLRRLG